jgi:hypothetical protein
MDYRALAELLWFALLGLSVLTAVTGLTLKFVVGPFVRELIQEYWDRSATLAGDGEVRKRLARLEARLVDLHDQVDGLRAGRRFDRELTGGGEE